MSDLESHYTLAGLNEQISHITFEKRYPRTRNDALVYLAGSGERVLEIGCGTGNVLHNIRSSYKEVYGVEFSKSRAENLGNYIAKNKMAWKISAGNIEEGLPYESNFFDTILWADVIEHTVNVVAAMKEVVRLLKPGGRVITCTPNVAELRRRIKFIFGMFPATSEGEEGFAGVGENDLYDGGHLHYFTFGTLEKLYKLFDLQREQKLGFGRLGCFHNIYPELLSSGIALVGRKSPRI
jgi:SAM-dependent methyltransferase